MKSSSSLILHGIVHADKIAVRKTLPRRERGGGGGGGGGWTVETTVEPRDEMALKLK